jgi:hypothetical protein
MTRLSNLLARGALVLAAAMPATASAASTDAALVCLERVVVQDQGRWRVEYRLRYDGPDERVVPPSEVSARVEGWVSNARVPGLEAPLSSKLAFHGDGRLTAVCEVIASPDDAVQTRERGRLSVWASHINNRDDDRPDAAAAPASLDPIALAPGDLVRVRLELEHLRFLYGKYDPLLGERRIELSLGGLHFRDRAPLDRERRVPPPRCELETPPPDRLDPGQFLSPPHSLHLEAHVPGNQYYRFRDQDVRYATPMKLSFWYLVAHQTQGKVKARVAQYRDCKSSWKVLPEGGFEVVFEREGCWTFVERVFTTQAEATTLGLDFRIVGSDLGEAWIDDIKLEALGAGPSGP